LIRLKGNRRNRSGRIDGKCLIRYLIVQVSTSKLS
jgi:hypothetical protein